MGKGRVKDLALWLPADALSDSLHLLPCRCNGGEADRRHLSRLGRRFPILKDNVYHNPFWSETAFFKSDKGHAFRVAVYWNAAVRGCERGQWIGTKMSFYDPHPNGLGPVIVRSGTQTERDQGGFVRQLSPFEKYEQPEWWKTEMLPAPLRHSSGHDGSHTFLTHEFIDALARKRKPAIDVFEAVAYTVPGIIAHRSALEDGRQMKIPVYGQGSA